MQNGKACCLQTHMPINLRGNWPVLVMPRPRSRCWTWNHRWICAQATPCQQIWLDHSDRSQATEQMLALQEPLRLESNEITVAGDGTQFLFHQTSSRLLWAIVSNRPSLWPCAVFGLLGPVLMRTLPYQVNDNLVIYAIYSWSHFLCPLHFCCASPWLALKENPVKMIRQVSLHVWCFSSVISFPLTPSLHTLVINSPSFMLLDLELALCSWLFFHS